MSLPQPVATPLTRSAIFIVLTVKPGDGHLESVRAFLGDRPSLLRAVGFRNDHSSLSCVVGFGADLWSRFSPDTAPTGLHPFREIHGVHRAPSTPGNLLLHIRANQADFSFELATYIMRALGDAVTVEDETQGFRYFDNRDLIGFVDGTENPAGADLDEAVLIGDEDPRFRGGSYVIVQKYLHDLTAWEAIPVEQQERIIGRRKLSDIELSDSEKATYSHNVLTSLEDADGNALEILRDNMPFGSPAFGEFGTYFIGYAREPGRIETMLDHMFIGDPPGNYDRLLDVSRAVTGGLFFVPSEDVLQTLAYGKMVGAAEAPPVLAESVPAAFGSLAIGSLKQGV